MAGHRNLLSRNIIERIRSKTCFVNHKNTVKILPILSPVSLGTS